MCMTYRHSALPARTSVRGTSCCWSNVRNSDLDHSATTCLTRTFRAAEITSQHSVLLTSLVHSSFLLGIYKCSTRKRVYIPRWPYLNRFRACDRDDEVSMGCLCVRTWGKVESDCVCFVWYQKWANIESPSVTDHACKSLSLLP